MSDRGVLSETPTALIPKMNEFPVSNSAYYQKLVLTDPATGNDDATEFAGRLDVFGTEARDAVDAANPGPAVGVLLTFEQGWYQKGLALGELRKSLSLAPGEVTRLAMVDWRRATRSRDDASRTQSEQVRERLDDSATLHVVQEAVANEQRTGSSSNFATASHVEASANVSFLFWGASSSSSSSSHFGLAASSSTGRRDVASAASKDVERSTEQSAQSIRSARATQIREVSETESQSTSTRVVANYNHGHALTMQYYEVLQIYSLETKVVRAERCVFVPMKSFEFTIDALRAADERLIELLRRVLRDFDALVLDEVVGALVEHGRKIGADQVTEDSLIEFLRESLKSEQARLPSLTSRRQELASKIDEGASEAPGTGELSEVWFDERAVLERTIATVTTRIGLLTEAANNARRALGVLEKNRLLLNQQMWMRIEDYDWHRLLAGKVFPRAPYKDQPIGGVVDPNPVGFFGNYVAFKWDFPRVAPTATRTRGRGQPVATDAAAKVRNKEIAKLEKDLGSTAPLSPLETAEEFEAQFTDGATTLTQLALPTEGLFAESVLGRSNSAEKIDMARFWNWQDSPIPILPPSMSPVDTDSRARGVAAAAPIDFAPTLVELRKIGALPDDVDDAAVIAALENTIGGSAAEIAAAAGAARAAGNEALAGAGRAGQTVMDLQKQYTGFIVDLANSKAATAATELGMAAASGGASAGAKGGLSKIGGLLNQARKLPSTSSDTEGEP